MYLPDDIKNIIFSYHNQLKIEKLNKEFHKKVNIKIYSQNFSEYRFHYKKNGRIINYYRKKDKLLLMFRNNFPNKNRMNTDTVIKIIE